MHLPVLKLGIPTIAVRNLGLYPESRSDLYGFVADGIVFPPLASIRDLDRRPPSRSSPRAGPRALLATTPRTSGHRTTWATMSAPPLRALVEPDSSRAWPLKRSRSSARPADTAPAGAWKRHGARAASIAVSAALLFGLYRSLDVRLTGEALLKSDPLWLVISVGLIVPITVLRALRFLWVAPPGALPGLAEATRLTLAASALNVFVPLKAGDLIKSYFVARRAPTSAGAAVAVIVYERVSDLFALLFWCVLGWVVMRGTLPRGWSVAIVPLLALEAIFGTLLVSMRAARVWKTITARVLPGTGAGGSCADSPTAGPTCSPSSEGAAAGSCCSRWSCGWRISLRSGSSR